MKWLEQKTKEQIYSELLKEMKYWFPEVPESSDRLDPVLRLFLGTFAHQVEKLNQKINSTWDQTFRSLARNIFAEGLRRPVPACTVMKVDPADPILELDSSVQFSYQDEKEERSLIFSPLGKAKLLKAETALVYYHSEQDLFQLVPRVENFGKGLLPGGSQKLPSELAAEHSLYLGIRYDGSVQDFCDVPIFFHLDEKALAQIRWSRWFFCSEDGHFFEENSFCPGIDAQQKPEFSESQEEDIFSFSGVCRSVDLFGSFGNYFYYLPPSHLTRWKKCRVPHDLQKLGPADVIDSQTSNSEELFWIKIRLPEKADKGLIGTLKGIYLNCLLCINKKDLTFFKHTAGNELLEIELPEESTSILSINSVVDSNNKKYQNRLNLLSSKTSFSYVTEERNGHLILWFDFSDQSGPIPSSISVSYSTTLGSLGNGIEAGKIQSLWERHPGIRTVTNILPTSGGMPARTQEELLSEISSLLRNRGRAVSFEEIQAWTTSFDPRIGSAECENVVRKSSAGAFRSTRVNVRVKGEEFYSDDELKLLKKRLEDFLKARSLINVPIEVNIISD